MAVFTIVIQNNGKSSASKTDCHSLPAKSRWEEHF